MSEAKTDFQAVLTPSESKRLIAKGIAAWDRMREALKSATVVICKGTTNAYIVEELTGEKMDKTQFVTGHTLPTRGAKGVVSNKMPDLILVRGKKVEGKDAAGFFGELAAGDVVLKGANVINHSKKQAGLLIGHPTGGTMGALAGIQNARRVALVIPCGLEKDVSGDVVELSKKVNIAGRGGPTLWPFYGEIFTEIEALRILAGAEAFHIASGGIGGAEGAVRLLVEGSPDALGKAREVLDSVYGEKPFAGG